MIDLAKKFLHENIYFELYHHRAIYTNEDALVIKKEQGFTGTYPQYESEHLSVCVTEEHPFTILESEDFKFKIQLMISECREKHPRKNAGFFKGYQRKGKIKRLDF